MTSRNTKPNMEDAPGPQLVRWGPVDQKPPGIQVDDDAAVSVKSRRTVFISWQNLKGDVERMLLPQVRMIPTESVAQVRDLEHRKNWIVEIDGPQGNKLGDIWFGVDPDSKWRWDGLVRVGSLMRHAKNDPIVWQIFQRYSDGSYRRIEANLVKRN